MKADCKTAHLWRVSWPTADSWFPVYWDENSGPSSASESTLGSIPSEAFTVFGTQSSSTGTVPEPSRIILFGSGVLGLGALVRRNLF